MRSDRPFNSLRPVNLQRNANIYAEGSCLISIGETRVLCTASVEDRIPSWMTEGSGGWITAEYSMLPRANRQRSRREAKAGKQTGRTVEIQRLIGRSLRACAELALLEGYTITVDCDVLQADGGTRCAAVTGGYVALAEACGYLEKEARVSRNPLVHQVAAVSVGMLNENCLLDLCYEEDSSADVDFNVVMLDSGSFVEVQGTAEGAGFDREKLNNMLDLAERGIRELFIYQKAVI